MPQVRAIECKDVAGRDFAPSEMYLVVLTQDETETMYKIAIQWDSNKERTLQNIFGGSFRLIAELLD